MAILSWRDRETEALFLGAFPRRMERRLAERAQRVLIAVDLAAIVEALRVPPSNDLHRLGGDLDRRWSVTVRKPWCVTFLWEEDEEGPSDVWYHDYHR